MLKEPTTASGLIWVGAFQNAKLDVGSMPLVIKGAKLNIFPLMVECKFWYWVLMTLYCWPKCIFVMNLLIIWHTAQDNPWYSDYMIPSLIMINWHNGSVFGYLVCKIDYICPLMTLNVKFYILALTSNCWPKCNLIIDVYS
jgi:hypothetical protein